MGRPRGFDEDEVIAAAARLFAERAYDGVSVDDLVNHLGVHRNSLYKVFGSKRGLYLAALRWYVEHRLRPAVGGGGAGRPRRGQAGGAPTGGEKVPHARLNRAPQARSSSRMISGSTTVKSASSVPSPMIGQSSE
ncbi:TetR/AcrR family transcriptional regulator, partial [Nocardia farcinica]|uniref:TetR/AcrR family transcriptional regulator n=1 Tax=Nocardia farcinica TaxID=37329 RepID=UPI002453AC47